MRERPDDTYIQAGLWLTFLIKSDESFYGASVTFPSWNFPNISDFKNCMFLKIVMKDGCVNLIIF